MATAAHNVGEVLSRTIEGLRVFLAGSERVFLEAGTNLSAVASRAEALMAPGRIGAGERDALVHRLDSQINEMNACLAAVQHIAEASTGGLADIRAQIDVVNSFRDEFREAADTLPVLGLYARIENSRPGLCSVVLEGVAGEILRLAHGVAPKFDALFSETTRVDERVRSVRARMGALSRASATSSAGFARAGDGVEQLRQLWAALSEVTAAADACSGAVVSDVTAVLIALQTHDITRQRIEHVVEALEALRAEVRPVAHDPVAWGALVGPAMRVQVIQLRGARVQLTHAMQEMSGRLHAIAEAVGEVRSRTSKVAGSGGSSPISQVEAGLSATTATLRTHLESHRSATTELQAVTGATAAMTDHVTAIKGVGADVMLVAYNAIIIAAQLGQAGRAFSAVAGEVQVVARRLGKHTQVVAAALQQMSEAAESLRAQQVREGEHLSTHGEVIVGGLDGIVRELRDAQAELVDHLSALAMGSGTLDRQVAVITRQLDAQTVVTERLSELEDLLAVLGEDASAHTGASFSLAELDEAALLETYTMESEREIHRAALGGAVVAAPAANPADAANIELF